MRALLLLLAVGCSKPVATEPSSRPDTEDTPVVVEEQVIRIATFNTSLYREASGALASALADPGYEPGQLAAAILQELRPDVVLLQEFDYDAEGAAIAAFQNNFLAVSQDGREPLTYDHVFLDAVNTGVPSGVDLDGDGISDHPEGTREYGDDGRGFGVHPGQYGMVLLSRFPLGEARTFRNLLWTDMPDGLLPTDHYSAEAAAVLPLSSKSHWDVPVTLPDGTVVHALAAHPTPPTFDGPEDRNGRRNHDEIRLWTDYLDDADWIVDDAGVAGGLPEGSFVVLGDHNSDPFDGDSIHDAIQALLGHPRARDTHPRSPGGAEQAALQGGANAWHGGPPAEDTADFQDSSSTSDPPGNLRVDYALPSADLDVVGSGVFWPQSDDPAFALIGTFPFPLTDHRPVWVDVRIGGE